MTTNNTLKYIEELKEASHDLRLLTEAIKQISDLCHRKSIRGEDICHVTDYLQKSQSKIVIKLYRCYTGIEFESKK
jgi:hypothetical protein